MIQSIRKFFISLIIGEVKGGEHIDLTYGSKRVKLAKDPCPDMDFNTKSVHLHRELYKMHRLTPKL